MAKRGHAHLSQKFWTEIIPIQMVDLVMAIGLFIIFPLYLKARPVALQGLSAWVIAITSILALFGSVSTKRPAVILINSVIALMLAMSLLIYWF